MAQNYICNLAIMTSFLMRLLIDFSSRFMLSAGKCSRA